MDLRFIYSLLLTILPVTELRVGLPLALTWALDKNIPIIFVFSTVLLVNIIIIFFIFYFLDNLHHVFMKFKLYRKPFEYYISKFQKRVDKFEKKYEAGGFIALMLFVAVPLPGTGAWSGCLVAWLLGLERRQSIIAIASGVIIAGILILLGSLGIISMFFS